MIRDLEQPPETEAIEAWRRSRTWHHSVWSDHSALAARKREKGLTVGVCIPTLNEAATIGDIVRVLHGALVERAPLLDELVVMDSGSTDGTREIAAQAGARVVLADEVLPSLPGHRGKGENLWKALHAMKSDILCHVDGDIANMHPRFVTGLVGPLLDHPELNYVKAYYRRPLAGLGEVRPAEGGRVTEILVRPLFAAFFPELSGFIQPLSGEYAARRPVLEGLAYPVGYGVETAHLIDIWRASGLGTLAQVDLEQRLHRHQPTLALGRMAHGILQCLLRRVRGEGFAIDMERVSPWLKQFEAGESGDYHPREYFLPEIERPPIREIEEYRASRAEA